MGSRGEGVGNRGKKEGVMCGCGYSKRERDESNAGKDNRNREEIATDVCLSFCLPIYLCSYLSFYLPIYPLSVDRFVVLFITVYLSILLILLDRWCCCS